MSLIKPAFFVMILISTTTAQANTLNSIALKHEAPAHAETATDHESAAAEVWAYYKSLTGNDTKALKTDITKAPPKPKAQSAPSNTGIVGILQQHRESQKRRGGLNSMKISKPDNTPIDKSAPAE